MISNQINAPSYNLHWMLHSNSASRLRRRCQLTPVTLASVQCVIGEDTHSVLRAMKVATAASMSEVSARGPVHTWVSAHLSRIRTAIAWADDNSMRLMGLMRWTVAITASTLRTLHLIVI